MFLIVSTFVLVEYKLKVEAFTKSKRVDKRQKYFIQLLNRTILIFEWKREIDMSEKSINYFFLSLYTSKTKDYFFSILKLYPHFL